MGFLNFMHVEIRAASGRSLERLLHDSRRQYFFLTYMYDSLLKRFTNYRHALTDLQTLKNKCPPEIIHGVHEQFLTFHQSPNIYSAYQYTKNHQLTFQCTSQQKHRKTTMDGLKKGDLS